MLKLSIVTVVYRSVVSKTLIVTSITGTDDVMTIVE